MIGPPPGVRILVATRPVDFRKGMDGLAALAQQSLGQDPFCGTVLVFRAKRADRVKLLALDGSGLVLVSKRLEEGRFRWPPVMDGLMRLSPAQQRASGAPPAVAAADDRRICSAMAGMHSGAMEACCGAHHLGRQLVAQGHQVRLMSPEYVRPYVKAAALPLPDASLDGYRAPNASICTCGAPNWLWPRRSAYCVPAAAS